MTIDPDDILRELAPNLGEFEKRALRGLLLAHVTGLNKVEGLSLREQLEGLDRAALLSVAGHAFAVASSMMLHATKLERLVKDLDGA